MPLSKKQNIKPKSGKSGKRTKVRAVSNKIIFKRTMKIKKKVSPKVRILLYNFLISLNKPIKFPIKIRQKSQSKKLIKKSSKLVSKRSNKKSTKESKEFIFPLYFGWEIVFRRVVDWNKHIVGPFKKYWQYISVVIFLILLSSTVLILNQSDTTKALTYNWIQSSWVGGDSVENPDHENNRTNWTKYISADDLVATSTDLSLTSSSSSTIQTTDTDFNAGATSTAVVSGTGSSAYIVLDTVAGAAGSSANAGGAHSCALKTDGTVFCWGYNGGGRLGDDSETNSTSPVQVHDGEQTPGTSDYLADATQLTAGYGHNCVVTSDGSAYCWGYQSNVGCLGDNTEINRLTPIQVQDGDQTPGVTDYLQNVSQIFAAKNYTCATITDGSAYCWGYNDSGQLGNNTIYEYHVPEQVLDGEQTPGATDYLENVSKIVGGHVHTCAIITDGSVYCWGDNAYGQLGNGGEPTDSRTPVRVLDGEQNSGTYLANVSSVALGANQTCASIADGSVYCWGRNYSGNLGNNTNTDSGTPVRVLDGEQNSGTYLANVSSVALGESHSCAFDTSGDAYCWGEGIDGRLGYNSTSDSWVPVKVLDGEQTPGVTDYIENISQISLGTSRHSCVSDTSGDAYCWGDGVWGKLGDGASSDRWTPVQVDGINLTVSAYETSGNFISSSIDLSQTVNFGTLTYSSSTPANTDIQFQVAANNDNATWSFIGPDGTDSSYFTASGTQIPTSLNGSRYFKYKAFLTSSDDSVTPSLEDVTVNFYNKATLISSIFNSSSTANILNGVTWDEDATLPSGSGVTIDLRASTTAELVATTDWIETASTTALGFITTGCTKDTATVTCSSSVIDSTLKDLVDDQYMQYRITLDGGVTVDDITVVYVVNAAPELQNVTASQGSDGLVSISYDVRDSDTTTGTTTPSFQYWNGSSWSTASTLSSGATDDKTVEQVSYNTYSLTWDPTTDFSGQYQNGTAQIRVTANDGEIANNTATLASATFTLDTKVPVADTAKIESTTDTITFSITEDSLATVTMMISNESDYSADGLNDDSGNWITYNSTSSWNFTGEPETVYYKIKDGYGNSATSSITTPAKASNVVYQDISNSESSDWREFIAWGEIAVPNPGFKRYNIYKSSNGTDYSLLTTETDIGVNYLVDTAVTTGTTYYYKITSEDNDDNISNYSSIVSDDPDGQGGSDLTSPTISSVALATSTTQSAQITWNTDEPANSLVEYITVTGGDFTSAPGVTVATMLDNASGLGVHSVYLTGLTASTTYYYQVKSADPSSNTATSKDGTDGYSFTTLPGPVISNVSASDITNSSSTITWITNTSSNSQVIYSINSDLSSPTTVTGSDDLTTGHSVTISGLTQGTNYYYYVKSTDSESNVATDNNGGDYYTFITIADVTGPTISNVTNSIITDDEVLITWDNSEKATGLLNYGTASATYTASSTNTDLNLGQSIQLTGLTADTTYYYQIIATDINSNASTSAEYTVTTLEVLSEESEVVVRENAARAEGTTTVISSSCGGGGGYSKDTLDPTISDISISNVTNSSASIGWNTNEKTDSFVQYGTTDEFDVTLGQYEDTKTHLVVLNDLLPATTYYYKVLAEDDSNNLASSDTDTFITSSYDLPSNIDSINENSTSTTDSVAEAINFSQTMESISSYLARMASKVSLSSFESIVTDHYNAINYLSSFVPSPILSGEPGVVVGSNSALVSWQTDKQANSFISYASDNYYRIENDYEQTISNSDIYTTNHQVYIAGLEPETNYHYRVKSKSQLGLPSESDDFVFKTNREQAEIKSYSSEALSNDEAEFKWATTIETTSQVRYIPYRNNTLMVDEALVKIDKSYTTIHSLIVDNLESGVIYQVELYGEDVNNNIVSKVIPAFTTNENNMPPVISQVKTDTALSFGKTTKVQAIISWKSNEPASSRVYFQKGLVDSKEGFTESTPLDNNFSRSHIAVITNFEPGAIYKFQVENTDSSGNSVRSRTYTILTPRQSESVFQVIIKNIENTFGWLKLINR